MEGLGAGGPEHHPGVRPRSGLDPPDARPEGRKGWSARISRMADWDTIFKAYDVRGVYPDQLDEEAAYRIGRAFASWSAAPRIVLG